MSLGGWRCLFVHLVKYAQLCRDKGKKRRDAKQKLRHRRAVQSSESYLSWHWERRQES